MVTDVSVVIAYRDMGCEHRRRSFERVNAWYLDRGYDVVVESGTDDASFARGKAINAAIERAGGRVIVQSDPDSLVPDAVLEKAIAWAGADDIVVIPHSTYYYLTREATERKLAAPDGEMFHVTPEDCEFSGPAGSGNVVVFSREAWDSSGRYDERFGLWGGDDSAFRYAVEAFHGPVERLVGPMVHLWHPRLPQSDPGHPAYIEQFAVLAQYRDAAAIGPQAVRDLVRSRA